MANPQLVVIVWKDAWVDGSDTLGMGDPDPKHRPTVMQTIGWLLKEDEEGVSLFNERCLDKGEEVYRSRTFIPSAMVLSITPFTLARPRTKKVKPEAS